MRRWLPATRSCSVTAPWRRATSMARASSAATSAVDPPSRAMNSARSRRVSASHTGDPPRASSSSATASPPPASPATSQAASSTRVRTAPWPGTRSRSDRRSMACSMRRMPARSACRRARRRSRRTPRWSSRRVAIVARRCLLRAPRPAGDNGRHPGDRPPAGRRTSMRCRGCSGVRSPPPARRQRRSLRSRRPHPRGTTACCRAVRGRRLPDPGRTAAGALGGARVVLDRRRGRSAPGRRRTRRPRRRRCRARSRPPPGARRHDGAAPSPAAVRRRAGPRRTRHVRGGTWPASAAVAGLARPRAPRPLGRRARCVSARRLDPKPSTAASGVGSAERRDSLAGPAVVVGQLGGQLEGPLEEPHRLVVGVPPLGLLGGLHVPGDGVAEVATSLVVPRQLSADRSGVGVQLQQGGRQQAVVVSALCGAEPAVGDLADLVVREVVLVHAAVVDDAPPPQLVEGAGQAALSRSAAAATTSDVKSRPTLAATPTSCRAVGDSWARRAETTAWRLGVSGRSAGPASQPARTVSTTNSGFPSVSP